MSKIFVGYSEEKDPNIFTFLQTIEQTMVYTAIVSRASFENFENSSRFEESSPMESKRVSKLCQIMSKLHLNYDRKNESKDNPMLSRIEFRCFE